MSTSVSVMPLPDTASTPAHGSRVDFLDGIRGLMALYVVLYHAMILVPIPAGSVRQALHFYRVFGMGHEAVDVFIVLSGLSLAISVVRNQGYVKNGALAFYVKRGWRILPPFYAALVLSLVLNQVWLSQPVPGSFYWSSSGSNTSIWLHFLLLHDLFPFAADKVNTSLWSVSVEWRIYLVFPLLVGMMRRVGGRAVGILFLASALLLVVVGHWVYPLTNLGPSPQYLGLFALGVWGMHIMKGSNPLLAKWRRLPWKPIALVTSILAFVNVAFPLVKIGLWNDYVVGVAAVATCVYLYQNAHSSLRGFLSSRPLVFLGAFSYSLYLVHIPVLELVLKYGVHSPARSYISQVCGLMLFGTATAAAFAYVFFLLVERRFLSFPHSARLPHLGISAL